MGSISGSSGSTKPDIRTLAGLFDNAYSKGAQLGSSLESKSGLDFSWKALRDELTNPNFNPQTSTEQGVAESTVSQAHGVSALRGLGRGSVAGVANALAPTLSAIRTQRVNNLREAMGLDIADVGTNMGNLLELAGLAKSGYIGGQDTEEKGMSAGISWGGGKG